MRLLPFPGVFQPPSDAWLLADCLKRERLGPGVSVLDLCSGSGMLAIAAAREGASPVTAVDISRRAIAVVRLNAAINRVKVEAVRGDLFGAVEGRRFDVIVSNPPYLPGESAELPAHGLARAWEGGPSGRAFIARIAAGSRAHLTPGGVLLLVCSSVCGERETLESLRAGGLAPTVLRRRRGPLGPRLSARTDWLRRRRLLLDDRDEEILVFRAPAPAAAARPARRGDAGVRGAGAYNR